MQAVESSTYRDRQQANEKKLSTPRLHCTQRTVVGEQHCARSALPIVADRPVGPAVEDHLAYNIYRWLRRRAQQPVERSQHHIIVGSAEGRLAGTTYTATPAAANAEPSFLPMQTPLSSLYAQSYA
jgi:hypothetical protein